MTRTRLAWLVGTLACAYALAFTVHGASAGLHRASAAEAKPEPMRIAAQRRQLSGSRDAGNASASPSPSRAVLPAPASASSMPAPAPQPPAVEDYVRAYELALEREARDSAWQAQVDSALAATLASAELAGVHMTDQRCGRTLCRVDVRCDSLMARQRAEEALPLREPFNSSDGLVRAGSADSLTVTVYFARPGHALPDPRAS